MSPGRLAEVAVYATIGPVTGLLVSRLLRHWRNGDRVLAGLYGIAVLTTWLDLSLFASRLALTLHTP